jgi:DNA polymerase I-like protein with 3'-5' exonuclease and polymerase domains
LLPFLVFMIAFPVLYSSQVHDELIFEVRQPQLLQAAALVRRVMEGHAALWGLRVALPVRLQQGRSWGELAEFEDDRQLG